ncbi:MAG: prepilin-type N-terminal cleavage/methylation domain-containing protein [Deltaproteobacteria bacterium]|nr:prepilin-type N-terminal cleavage/methylation domain-containing protein [Deltaproteobacteria bacterium]
MPRPACSCSRGFSLIELMIVLVIMGLMLAFVGPRVAKSLGGLGIKTAAKKIAGTLRYAKGRAVNTGSLYTVIFDTEKKRVILLRAPQDQYSRQLQVSDNGSDADESDDEETEQPSSPAQEIKIYRLPPDIALESVIIGTGKDGDQDEDGETAEISQMAFYPNGTSQGGEIVVTDPAERTQIIRVDYLTGVVSIEEQEEE